jgi:hypothetical protein
VFDPTRDQVRRFFIDSWRKHREQGVLTPLEAMACDIILLHPEYHAELSHVDALEADYSVEQGRTNPFLHLSMHLALAEQISIDQPPGIRAAFESLSSRADEHKAFHELMECLGEVVWEAQRLGKPLNNESYLALIQRRATTF